MMWKSSATAMSLRRALGQRARAEATATGTSPASGDRQDRAVSATRGQRRRPVADEERRRRAIVSFSTGWKRTARCSTRTARPIIDPCGEPLLLRPAPLAGGVPRRRRRRPKDAPRRGRSSSPT